MNCYLVLGIRPDADEVAIRRAFRALARQYHPDAGGGSSAEKFRELVTAYETLIDPRRRRAYDRSNTLGSPYVVPVTSRYRRAPGVRPTSARAAPEPLIDPRLAARRRRAPRPWRVDPLDETLGVLLCLLAYERYPWEV